MSGTTRPPASTRLASFASATAAGKFTGIPRATVASGLITRMADASKINQNPTSLCGPATLLYNVARHDADMYGHYIMDLYETGKGTLGKITVEPGSDCRAYTPKTIHGVDWIGLAGLRDSENALWDYQSEDNEVAGITMPGDVASWLKKAGRGPTTDKTNLVFTKSLTDLIAADTAFRAGKTVCLFISAAGLDGPTKKAKKAKGGTWTPDHWVTLTSSITLGGAPISTHASKGASVNGDATLLDAALSFTVYTWGDDAYAANGSTARDFLRHFYGYVEAK